jgi:hypothetical protein
LNLIRRTLHPEAVEFRAVATAPFKEFDKFAILGAIAASPFSLTYVLHEKVTLLGMGVTSAPAKFRAIESSVPGLQFKNHPCPWEFPTKYTTMYGYRLPQTIDGAFFNDVFSLGNGTLSIIFTPVRAESIKHRITQIEASLSSRKASETHAVPSSAFDKNMKNSYHSENFEGSGDAMLLASLIESINSSVTRNGICYDIRFVAEGPSTDAIVEYLRCNLVVASEEQDVAKEAFPLGSGKFGPFPVGGDFASRLLNLHCPSRLSYSIKTPHTLEPSGIEIGKYVRDGALRTNDPVRIDPTTLNLGMIISGLPGSGKTNECMALVDALIAQVSVDGNQRPKVAILSPTDEWAGFAMQHSMNLVKLYDGRTPINFFCCPRNCEPVKFYGDLSMLLASASNAGPYKGPMEKCILNAFKKVYAKTSCPNPIDAYDAIEESIIEFHARRTKSEVKYTKHGENIRSSLENLREILARSEYSSEKGIDLGDAIVDGAVFDMSMVGNSAKPYMSALILNQIYSLASSFPTNSENILNMLICVEEAQTIFKDRESAAVQDLKLRIQDFRKQGIGLVLMAHNATDIDQGIRRLCQTKLYMKQASDVAPIAASDLMFTYAEEDEVIQKLRHLDSRIGALSRVTKQDGEKIAEDTVFIRTSDLIAPSKAQEPRKRNTFRVPRAIDSKITITVDHAALEGKAGYPTIAKISCLGERICSLPVDQQESFHTASMVEGRKYRIELIDRIGRILGSSNFICSNSVHLLVGYGTRSKDITIMQG